MEEFNRLCILDLETTGIYGSSDAPVQIAALIVDMDGNDIATFNEKIKTTHAISPEASAVHGIYKKDLENCRGEIAVLEDFCAGIKGNEVDAFLTYNGTAFDLPMLNERCKKCGIDFDGFAGIGYQCIDGKTKVFDAKKMSLFGLNILGRKGKLTLVAEHLGFSSENAHDALADVRMLKQVYFKLRDYV